MSLPPTDPHRKVQPEMFHALVSWVEKDQAPENLTTTRYDRKGEPAEASSFSCKPNLGHWPRPQRS